MSSSSDVNLIALLSRISMQLTRYLGMFIFIFGVVGNILNILVLSRRPLRSNSCACLFLAASVAYLISLVCGVMPRFLSTWDADLSNTNQILCKIRIFFFFVSITAAFWLIMLATVDRWLSSSTDHNRRQRSTLKNAQRGTILILIFSAIIEAQHIYCFEANLTNTPLKCYTKSVTCAIISDTFFALLTILVPLVLMFIFGLVTISNVRQAQSRLQPENMTNNNRVDPSTATVSSGHRNGQRKTDRQLLIMLVLQVSFMLLFTVPFALSKLYTTLTQNTPKSTLRITAEGFIFNLLLLFLNIASGMPFYIYTLCGGSVFRKALFSLLKAVGLQMLCRPA